MPQAGICALMNLPLVRLPAAVERCAAAQGARGPTMTQMQEEVDLLNFTALMNLGIAVSDLGTFDEASVRLEAALQLLPDSPEALQNVGMNLCARDGGARRLRTMNKPRGFSPTTPRCTEVWLTSC